MTRRHAAFALVFLAIVSAAACRRAPDPPAASSDDSTSADAAAQAWRVKHEEDYRRDWVPIAGLHPLKPGVNTAGSDPASDIVLPASTAAKLGEFTLDGERVRFTPADGAQVLLRKEPVSGPIDLNDDRARTPDELVAGEVRMVVHVSGTSRGLRVRDANGPQARGFVGFSWFPIDARYRVIGRFIKDPEPKRVKVVNTYGDVDEYTVEGTVEFELAGQTLRLRPFTTRPNRFYFVFRDESSGEETYETARFLYSDLREDGTTVLDFNVAYNPPCAFNPYTTCPIPLRENRLPVKILAGERAYAGHVGPPAAASK
jgi:uncharacterized protein (DUF1684 family)